MQGVKDFLRLDMVIAVTGFRGKPGRVVGRGSKGREGERNGGDQSGFPARERDSAVPQSAPESPSLRSGDSR